MLVINVSRLLVGFSTSYSESPCQNGAGYFAHREMKRQLLKASVEAIILGFERMDSQLVSKDVSNFGYADERRSFRLLIHVQQVA